MNLQYTQYTQKLNKAFPSFLSSIMKQNILKKNFSFTRETSVSNLC